MYFFDDLKNVNFFVPLLSTGPAALKNKHKLVCFVSLFIIYSHSILK